jgi:pyruvate formate lyase activating enzyme
MDGLAYMESGLVLNIQRYSIHDGPGIRTTVFLKGCPLTCWWCHNPESQCARPEVIVVETRCIRCGLCREVCPAEQLPPNAEPGSPQPGDGVRAAPVACTLCGACVDACPAGAVQLAGRRMTVAEVLAEVRRDRIFYDDCGGGLTVSGGEPLMQPAFVIALLRACRDDGISTAVDTSGCGAREHLLEMAPFTDLFLYDLKLADSARHAVYTGAANKGILENLRALGEVHGNIWIRIPLLPGINDSPGDLDAAGEIIRQIKGVQQVNLLAYHETAAHKLQRLGRPYRAKEISAPTSRQMDIAAERMRKFGLSVKTGG